MNRIKLLVLLLASASLILILGCGVMFGGTKQEVSINSSPEGATVTINPTGRTVTTPATVMLERKNGYNLVFEKEGYKTKKAFIGKNIRGGIVVLDVLTGLIGVVIDAVTGGWYKLNPDSINVILEKEEGAGRDLPERISIDLKVQKITETISKLSISSNVKGVKVHVHAVSAD